VVALPPLFPEMAALAALDPASLALPQSRRVTFGALTGALAGGAVDLGPGSDWQQARAQLGGLPGLGPWSIETIAMRGLGDPDAFTAGDLGIRAAARQLGLPATPAALTSRASAWRPWRAYAVQYLWATGDHAINRIPRGDPAPPRAPARRPGDTGPRRRDSA
jgi:AraC family transcriptional regulator, regulatory protein of adaptative response / DNA-3-methyladenine glycosylase II